MPRSIDIRPRQARNTPEPYIQLDWRQGQGMYDWPTAEHRLHEKYVIYCSSLRQQSALDRWQAMGHSWIAALFCIMSPCVSGLMKTTDHRGYHMSVGIDKTDACTLL